VRAQRGLDDPTFATQSALVLIPVSVTDRHHRPLLGLAQDAFTIDEDQQPQTIAFFGHEDSAVTVGLVIDNSGSMAPKRALVAEASRAFAHASNPDDELFLVNFNEQVDLALPEGQAFTSDVAQMDAALNQLRARGLTRLYDGIDVALDHLARGTKPQRALVVLSDGGDNASTTTLEALRAKALASSAVIYTVGLFSEDDSDGNAVVLKDLARISGGDAFLVQRLLDVRPALTTIAQQIRHTYTLGYVPTNIITNGGFRTLRVRVHSARGKRTIVRTRLGYDAGLEQFTSTLSHK
jgi:Ca-activated chloride channel family protein